MVVPMMTPAMAVGDDETSLETPVETPVVSYDTSVDAWDGSIATSFAGGSGSSANPYKIATGAQLAYLAKLINDPETSNTYATKYYKLTADINLGNREWTPIGGYSYQSINGVSFRFGGKFNGNNHTIYNFCVAEEKESVGAGLFGILTSSAEIKNLTLIGQITAGAKYNPSNAIGGSGMLAVASYGAKISYVDIYVNMYIKSSGDTTPYIGGMFGYSCEATQVTDCNLYGSITLKHSDGLAVVGGLVGRARRITAKNVVCDVDIFVQDGGYNYQIGGFIGETDSNTVTTDVVTLKGCTYSGDIDVYLGIESTTQIGGMIGRVGAANYTDLLKNGIVEITDCFHDGKIEVTYETENDSKAEIGSMIGYLTPNEATLKNYFTTSTLPLYNLDENGVYGEGGMTLNDQGGHITGIAIGAEYGVALRLTGGSTGLRYNSTIKRDLYEALAAHGGMTFTLGTLIAPTSYVQGAGGFTKEFLSAYAAAESYANAYVDVKFNPTVNGWLDAYSNDDSVHVFSGAISNLKEASYNLAFSGVGYVEIKSSIYSHTFYGEYTESARSRTAAYIAEQARADRQATQDAKYQYLTEAGDYSPYTDTQRTYIEEFYAKMIAGAMNTTALKLFENGKSSYAIVYAFGSTGAERDLAVYLQQAIFNLTGVMLPVREGCATNEKTPYEIVIGCYEYASAYKVHESTLAKGYSVFTADQRVIILGSNDQALACAIRAFVDEVFDVDMTQTLTLTPNTNTTATVSRFLRLEASNVSDKPLNVDLSSYKLVYSSNNEISKRMAYSFQQRYLEATGKLLTLTSWAFSGKRINFTVDSAYTNGDFAVSTSGSVITVTAGSYYGFEGAEDYILSEALYGLAPLTTSGFSMSGNYKY